MGNCKQGASASPRAQPSFSPRHRNGQKPTRLTCFQPPQGWKLHPTPLCRPLWGGEPPPQTLPGEASSHSKLHCSLWHDPRLPGQQRSSYQARHLRVQMFPVQSQGQSPNFSLDTVKLFTRLLEKSFSKWQGSKRFIGLSRENKTWQS